MEVTRVTSEALQARIRALLPSQQGFGEDLQASNVIIPIIDLTSSAEGSALPTDLQTALAFDSQTAFNINNATSTIVNNTGFYRIFGVSSMTVGPAPSTINRFTMSDGLTTKTIWEHIESYTGTGAFSALQFDFVVFLTSGDSISGTSTQARASIIGSSRQIADVNGNLVNPSGFVSS